MSPNDNRIDARDWSLLAVLSVLWGGSFFFNGAALRELPPLTLVFLRVALGAAILLPLLRDAGHRAFPRAWRAGNHSSRSGCLTTSFRSR